MARLYSLLSEATKAAMDCRYAEGMSLAWA